MTAEYGHGLWGLKPLFSFIIYDCLRNNEVMDRDKTAL
jgi:hypothetical protein